MESTEFPEVGHFTCSIGITGITADDTPQSAFERADKALYEAKNTGRNCVISAEQNQAPRFLSGEVSPGK